MSFYNIVASPRRIEKINNLLQEEIAKILTEETEIPEGNLITVTKAFTSKDAHYATILISILGKDPGQSLENIEKSTYHIQQQLNRRLKMRPVPRIKFIVDRGGLEREKIERTLTKLKQKGEI